MTDRTIDSSVYDATDQYIVGNNTVFTSQNTGYCFYADSGGVIVVAKTTDGGTNWTAANTTIDSANSTLENVAIWYDKWTPSRSGTIVHLAYVGVTNDTLYYNTFDTSNDSVGSPVTIEDVGVFQPADACPSICVATNGDIHALCGASDGIHVSISTNGGTSFSDNDTSTPITATLTDDLDYSALLPLLGGDVLFIGLDQSANNLYSLVYDQGTTSWDTSFTTIMTNFLSGSQAAYGTCGDQSGNVYLILADNQLASSGNVDLWKYTESSRTWAEKTSVITSITYCFSPAIAVDTTTGDLYAIYGTGTSGSTDIYYKVSQNDGTTWGSATQLSSTTDDLRYCSASGQSFGGDRVYATWTNDDLNDWIGESIAAIAGAVGTDETVAAGNLIFKGYAVTSTAIKTKSVEKGNILLKSYPIVETALVTVNESVARGNLYLKGYPIVTVAAKSEQVQKGNLLFKGYEITEQVIKTKSIERGNILFKGYETTENVIIAETVQRGNILFKGYPITETVGGVAAKSVISGRLILKGYPTSETTTQKESVEKGNILFKGYSVEAASVGIASKVVSRGNILFKGHSVQEQSIKSKSIERGNILLKGYSVGSTSVNSKLISRGNIIFKGYAVTERSIKAKSVARGNLLLKSYPVQETAVGVSKTETVQKGLLLFKGNSVNAFKGGVITETISKGLLQFKGYEVIEEQYGWSALASVSGTWSAIAPASDSWSAIAASTATWSAIR